MLAGTQDSFLWEFCVMAVDWEMLKNLKLAEAVAANIFGSFMVRDIRTKVCPFWVGNIDSVHVNTSNCGAPSLLLAIS